MKNKRSMRTGYILGSPPRLIFDVENRVVLLEIRLEQNEFNIHDHCVECNGESIAFHQKKPPCREWAGTSIFFIEDKGKMISILKSMGFEVRCNRRGIFDKNCPFIGRCGNQRRVIEKDFARIASRYSRR